MEAALADRLQFAFTVMFHYLFPIATIGLAPFVAYYTWKAATSDDPGAARAARFWTTIFTINFAAGVVTGIPMEFQFGTNWAAFSRSSGSVIGQPLAMESMFAFFLESIFLGALLYGRRGKPTRFMALAAAMVCLGSWLSGYFVVATDAWMQHPVGYVASRRGYELQDIWAVVLSPWARWQFAHVFVGALLAGSVFVAGIGAYYALAKRETDVAPRFLRAGVICSFIFAALAAFPTGDINADDVTKFQPIKLAAMEGLFHSERGAALAIIGMPDTGSRSLLDPIYVPGFLSYLAYGNLHADVKGLEAYPHEYWPPVELTYYAYHVMVGLGTIFGGVSALALLLLLTKRLLRATWALWLLMLMIPFPYIANEAGWVVTEVGRQPWLIYGLMRTAAGTSPTVSSGEALFTTIGFAGMYFLLGVLFLTLVLREIGLGPSHAFELHT